MRARSLTRGTAGIVFAALTAACGSSVEPEQLVFGSAPGDAYDDGGTPPSTDGGPVSCQALAETYGNLSDPTRWEMFDSTALDPAARGFTGMAYDGHFVYFEPYQTVTRSGIVARFERAATLNASGAWKTFDLSTLDPDAKGYLGSAFDGRYVYFAQFNDGDAYGGRVARLDTSADFESAAAWTLFDASTVNPESKGFAGTVFDGRYIYFLPYYNSNYDGVVTRYDTQSDFMSPAAWTTFDLTTKNGSARGFVSGTFDGRYVYLTPFVNLEGYSSTFARFDTQGSFDDTAAWSTFDTTTIDPDALGYGGAAFDGHYAYFFPTYNWLDGPHGDVVRFDTTTASFDDPTAWRTFDITAVNPDARGYIGGIFDGRYLTLIPAEENGVVARYDTLATFDANAAWTTFDLTTLSPNAKGFHSGGFDGRYIYMAEYWDGTEPNGLVVRFDAKSPTCTPSIPSSYLPKVGGGVASFF